MFYKIGSDLVPSGNAVIFYEERTNGAKALDIDLPDKLCVKVNFEGLYNLYKIELLSKEHYDRALRVIINRIDNNISLVIDINEVVDLVKTDMSQQESPSQDYSFEAGV